MGRFAHIYALLVCVLLAAQVTHAASEETLRSRLLVVLEDKNQKEEYSTLFSELDKIFETTYRLVKGSLEKGKKQDDIHLRFFDQPETPGLADGSLSDILGRTNDEFYYDNLMLLSPSNANYRGRGISSEELLQFFDSGRNIYIGANTETKNFARDMFKEFGAQIYPLKTTVTGGMGEKSIEGVKDSDLTWTSNINEAVRKRIVDTSSPLAYLGTGIKLDPENDYVFPILSGDIDTAANLPQKKVKGKMVDRSFTGEEVTLVAGYQSRYSQRAILSASIDMCSDKFVKASPANLNFCVEVAKWNFQQKSVLKLENFSHSLVDKSLVEKGLQKEQEYKLKDEIQVSFDLYEKVDNEWVPFHSEEDVTLEFIMLHPFVTENLENTEGAHYRVQFNVPDHNGVYKFKIDYNVVGLSRVYYDEITPVRVFNHDEFPRYVFTSYPYIAITYIIAGATILFIVQYALTEDKPSKVKQKED